MPGADKISYCTTGGLSGKTINDLQDDVNSRNIYLLVTTKNNPKVRFSMCLLRKGWCYLLLSNRATRLSVASVASSALKRLLVVWQSPGRAVEQVSFAMETPSV